MIVILDITLHLLCEVCRAGTCVCYDITVTLGLRETLHVFQVHKMSSLGFDKNQQIFSKDRISNKGEGSGIGLSISNEFVYLDVVC